MTAARYASILAALLAAGAVRGQTEQTSEPATPKAVEVKATGARLSYVPVDISPRRRNPRSEAGLLTKANAVLTTSRVLTYRRKELPGGVYRIAVERKDEKSWLLVFWPEDARTKSASSRQVEEKAGDEAEAGDVKREGEAHPALSVPLSLDSAESEDHRVVFELKPLEKGRRIQILVRAGSTQLTAALRWKTEEE